ncbi:hypothetical protein I79_018487 [Cricetulus griseus]|uniref:Uncharacterized protein n=1 Tax=Cricetulus griseus TaxID=10029 RepID=G3I4V0_CRIGR|nr:hypothetical protein I79_018487 [Cricetulus griseus]
MSMWAAHTGVNRQWEDMGNLEWTQEGLMGRVGSEYDQKTIVYMYANLKLMKNVIFKTMTGVVMGL